VYGSESHIAKVVSELRATKGSSEILQKEIWKMRLGTIAPTVGAANTHEANTDMHTPLKSIQLQVTKKKCEF
jgi:hypothetical protein